MANSFGDYLKRLRTCYNLTQRDLARLAGLGYSTVKQHEYNVCKPRLRALQAYVDVFGCNLYELIQLSEDTFNG